MSGIGFSQKDGTLCALRLVRDFFRGRVILSSDRNLPSVQMIFF